MGPHTTIAYPSYAPAVLVTIALRGAMLDVFRASGESGPGDSRIAANTIRVKQRLMVHISKQPALKA